MYAILDIETTGGKFNEEGITEIAIYKFDGHQVVDQFISLVNPEQPIQEFVVKLTGINNKMLRNAPKFYEIAKRILDITENCTLVAHNAEFDYRILRTEYHRLGFEFFSNTICTVELSRRLIPEQPSYSLGKLCRSLGIPMSDRHRANGDALATLHLFKLLLEKDTQKTTVEQVIKYVDKRTLKERLYALTQSVPEKEGVFYIHNNDGKVIYIGKGKNMQTELQRLFVKPSKRAAKIQEKAHRVSFEETGNMLFTHLKYALALESLSPKYNFKKVIKPTEDQFANDNFIILHRGRAIEEHAIILIENQEVVGYGYTTLAFQESKIEVLRTLLTPIKEKEIAKKIVKNHLKHHAVLKIIRLS